MPASPDLKAEIAALIAREGPIGLDRFMCLANDHYYATRDPLGVAGDFTTAPEISQMFGEIVGLALADLWQRAGRPDCAFVELGPGRGTLATDALRAMRVAGLTPPVHLVETSPRLRALQAERLPVATWHREIASLPVTVPLLIVANEFFDALPIRQVVAAEAGWCERQVTAKADDFAFATIQAAEDVLPALPADAPPGSVFERCPAAEAIGEALGARLVGQGGALLAFDYGYVGPVAGDTLQAVREHAYANPLESPGAQDLTAHVDFGALKAALAAGGAVALGPVEQGQWLVALGLSDRAAALSRRAPDRAEEIAAAYRRLTDAAEMGRLFKLLAATAPDWPRPAGLP